MKKIQSLGVALLCLAGTCATGQKPTITSFSPARAAAGSSITITGTNFNSYAPANVVLFGAAKGTVTAATSTSLTVTVPQSSTYKPITVLNSNTRLSASSATYFSPLFKGQKAALTSTSTITNYGGYYVSKVMASDIDNDGRPDLLGASNQNYFGMIKNSSTTETMYFPFWNNFYINSGYLVQSSQIADIDNDGVNDIFTLGASSTSSTAAWGLIALRNRTTSNFDFGPLAIANLSTPMRNSLAIGDMDADGRIDAVAVAANNRLLIVGNNSNSNSISFQNPVTYSLPTGFVPSEVAAADFNADGKPDVVISGTNAGANQVLVVRNTTIYQGTFTFVLDATLTLPSAPVGNIAIGEFNNNGLMDFALTTAGKRLVVFPNGNTTATVSFGTPVTTTIALGSTDYNVVTAGDLDGDGFADLTVSKSAAANTVTLFNKGTASAVGFDEVSQTAAPAIGAFPEIIDLNGDGTSDLVFATNQTVSVIYYAPPPAVVIDFLNPIAREPGTDISISGSGFNTVADRNTVYFGPVKALVRSASATSLSVTVPFGTSYDYVTVFNSDTKVSGLSPYPFRVSKYDCGTYNDSSFGSRSVLATTAGSSPKGPVFFDVNNDGKPDMIVANSTANTISVFQNYNSSGNVSAESFGEPIDFVTGATPTSIAVKDLTGDGKPEIVVTNSGSNTISVFRNTNFSGYISGNSFAAKTDIITGSSATSAPMGVDIADLDLDGRFDIAVTNRNDASLSVLINTTTAGSNNTITFSKTDLTTGLAPHGVVLFDMDNDKKFEIAVANRQSNTVSIFYNKSKAGAPSFNTKVDFNVQSEPVSVAAGELSLDAHRDLVVANYGSASVSVFRNAMTVAGAVTTSSLASPLTLAVGTSPSKVLVADYNGDGNTDILTANSGSNNISVILNNNRYEAFNAAGFAASRNFNSGSAPSGLAQADVDLDGLTDLAVTNEGQSSISLLQGRGTTYAGIVTSSENGYPSLCKFGDWVRYSSSSDYSAALFSIYDPENAFGLNLENNVYVESGPVSVGGKYFLGRHFAIVPDEQPSGPIRLRLYFTDAEFAALQQVDPGIRSLSDLHVTKYDGANVDGSLTNNGNSSMQLITPDEIVTGREFGANYVEFAVSQFSEFWINSGTAILPVNLLAFKADKTTNGVVLNWSTSSETSFSHFEVEKSSNGVQFQPLGQVLAGRSANAVNKYSYTDYHLPSAISYYRLKQVDKDGSFVYSNVLAVRGPGSALKVQMSPNPTSGKALLMIEGNLKNASFRLYNAAGTLVSSKQLGNVSGSASISIDRGSWPNGVYYFAVSSTGEALQKGKIVYK